jgi:hypothetical protein
MKEFYFKTEDIPVAVVGKDKEKCRRRACVSVYHVLQEETYTHKNVRQQIEYCIIKNLHKVKDCTKEYFLKYGDV